MGSAASKKGDACVSLSVLLRRWQARATKRAERGGEREVSRLYHSRRKTEKPGVCLARVLARRLRARATDGEQGREGGTGGVVRTVVAPVTSEDGIARAVRGLMVRRADPYALW